MSNNVSAVISNEAVTEIQDAVNTIRRNIPFLVSLTAEQRHMIPKMGNKTVSFVNKSLEYATQNPGVLPAYFDLAEFKKDVEAFNQLFRVVAPLQKLAEELDDTMMMAGSEAYTSALVFYNSLKSAIKTGQTGLKNVQDDLSSRFPSRSASEKAVKA